jgi:hypothetical protein
VDRVDPGIAGQVAVLMSVALLAGCASHRIPSEMRQDAHAICARANHTLDRIALPTSTSEQAASFLHRGRTALSAEVRQLRGLAASGDARPVYQAALQALSEESAALDAAATAIHGGANPLAVFKATQQRLLPLEVQANDAWQALGIPVCVE